ncbi:unnamed protein product, partial [Mesorhabditis spiculigera]
MSNSNRPPPAEESSDEESRTPIRRRRHIDLTPTNSNPVTGLIRGGSVRDPARLNHLSPGPIVHESKSATFKEGLIEGLDGTIQEVAPLLRTVSLRVRQQVQSTLSDPLKRKTDRIGSEIREGKRKMDALSAKLTLPKFMKDSKRSLATNDDAPSSSDDESMDGEALDQIERENIVDMYEKLRREKKWLAMLKQMDEHKPAKKLQERVWKGVPLKLKIRVWPRLLNIDRLRRDCRDIPDKDGKGIYDQLKARAKLVSRDVKQIDLDINRTFRNNEIFRDRYCVKQKSLLNVLVAYSMYNTEVGYCQGMSQIAGLFLMYLDEEEAFWCMHALMVSQKHTMHGFFVPGFPKLARFEQHYIKLVKKYKSKVSKHLDKLDIPYIYMTKWWFGCFLDRVPYALALRIWDVFLWEGDAVLLAMGLNIMKMHEKRILKCGFEQFMELVQDGLATNFGYSNDVVMESLHAILDKLRSDKLDRPPPPAEGSLPEVPTKAYGPILAKTLDQIKCEVAEVRSRSSRANSMVASRTASMISPEAAAERQKLKKITVATGRTPRPARRNNGAARLQSESSLQRDSRPPAPESFNATFSNGAPPTEEVPFKIPSRGSMKGSPYEQQQFPEAPKRGPVRPMGLSGKEQMRAYSSGKMPPAQPPSSTSSSLRMRPGNNDSLKSTDTSSRKSTYDNVHTDRQPSSPQRTITVRDDRSGKLVYISRGGDDDSPPGQMDDILNYGPEPPSVTHLANHVTYVKIGEDGEANEWTTKM